MQYKSLIFLGFTSLLPLGCAPERANFEHAQASSKSAAPSIKATTLACGLSKTNPVPPETSEEQTPPPMFAPPLGLGSLELRMTLAQRENLAQLERETSSFSGTLAPGMHRELVATNFATGASERLCQAVIAVDGAHAYLQIKSVDSDMEFAPRKVRIDQPDPIETAIDTLVQQDKERLLAALWPYLLLFYKLDARSAFFPEILVRVREAEFGDDFETFKLVLKINVKNMPEQEPLVVEAWIAPSAPRPFNIVYKAWGRGEADQVVLSATAFGATP